MSEIWPFDVKQRLEGAPRESIRPFRCVLLMPFEARFTVICDVIRTTVERVFESLKPEFQTETPQVERLDWVTSTGVIHDQLWRRVSNADLVFCDVTGHNANVLFEAGVCAAWLPLTKVVFIRDHFFKQQAPFDLAPLRYIEYSCTSDGIPAFQERIAQVTFEAITAFPDELGSAPKIVFPLEIDFRGNRDDLRIYTPSLAHRRVVNEVLEFGSTINYGYSWATIGKERVAYFELEASAKFCSPSRPKSLQIGFRSHHYFANYAHIFYMNADGSIVITQPDDTEKLMYKDVILRDKTSIDLDAFHNFKINCKPEQFNLEIDDFKTSIPTAKMPKMLGPGFIRFQAYAGWMGLKNVKVRVL